MEEIWVASIDSKSEILLLMFGSWTRHEAVYVYRMTHVWMWVACWRRGHQRNTDSLRKSSTCETMQEKSIINFSATHFPRPKSWKNAYESKETELNRLVSVRREQKIHVRHFALDVLQRIYAIVFVCYAVWNERKKSKIVLNCAKVAASENVIVWNRY